MSSSLEDFVKENKTKSHQHSSSTNQSLSSLQNGFNDLKSKLSTSISGFEIPLIGRSASSPTVSADGDAADSGQLPSSRNRKNSATWFGGFLAGSGENAFGLTRIQRMLGFIMCLFAGMACFGLAFMFLPVIVLQARKFAALNTLGSCFFLFSFALLWGPTAYIHHLFSRQRLAVTGCYLTSLLATLYSSLWLQNTLLALICAVVQLIALIWFLLTYVPGGERGLRLMTSVFGRAVKSQSKTVLPI